MVYCGRLSLVADLLQGLFKEAYSLQKGLLELLDRISLDSGASEEEISDIVTGVLVCIFVYASVCFPLPTPLLLSPSFVYTFNAIFNSLKLFFHLPQ